MSELAQKIENFLLYNENQRGLSLNSIKAYRQDLMAFLAFSRPFNHPKVTEPTLITDYLCHLRDHKKQGPATIRRRMVTLRKFFSWIAKNDQTSSPFSNLTLNIKVPKRLPRPVDRQSLKMICAQTSPLLIESTCTRAYNINTVTGLAIRMLIATGLRIGELTHLTLQNISGIGQCIRVMGKGARERTVYLTNKKLLEDFRAYWIWRSGQDFTHDFLLVNAHGHRLTEAAFRKRLHVISKTLQLESKITPHKFRHSAATLLIEEGVDIRIVQRLLGHASIATTELYTQVSDNSLLAALERADTIKQVSS